MRLGPGSSEAIADAARLIAKAERPVLLLGMLASEPRAAVAINRLLQATALPVVTTFQATGILTRDLLPLYAGRVGLFHNQPADRLLDAADLVVTIGYDPIEYDQALWNKGRSRNIVHIDAVPCDIDAAYRPAIEIIGDIADTHRRAGKSVAGAGQAQSGSCRRLIDEMAMIREQGHASRVACRSIPCGLVADLQAVVADDVTLCLDMGSFHIWIARYLQVFRPRQMVVSNGQQTLGRGPALGDRRLPGPARRQGDLDFGRRRVSLLLGRAGDGGAAEVQLRPHHLARRVRTTWSGSRKS